MPRIALLACLSAALSVASAAALAQTAVAASAAAAQPQLRVQEDDQVRIEELQVRGQTERVTIRHKHTGVLGALPRDYEIVTTGRGRDPSEKRAAVGQRVWNLFSF